MIRPVILLFISVAAMRPASAQPASAQAQAEAAFDQGKALMAKGQFADACKAFDASYALDPTVPTQLNQASCREQNHQLATAWGLFLEAERQTRTATDGGKQHLHQVAIEHAQQLASRVSKLTISVSAESQLDGLEILRDKDRVERPVWNVALPIDGGTYTITARAPGTAGWSSSVTIAAEGDTKTVDIPKLQALAPQPVKEPAVTAVTVPAPANEAPSAPAHGLKLAPLAVGVGALALGGVAVGLELSAESTYDQYKMTRSNSQYDSANTKRYLAEGLGAAGIAGAGVAVWLYLRGRHDEGSSTATARRLELVPTASGFALAGSY